MVFSILRQPGAERTVKCYRFYPNGEVVYNGDRSNPGVAQFLGYNRMWRPGNALFVNGKCVERGIGGFTDEAIAKIETDLAAGRYKDCKEPEYDSKGDFIGYKGDNERRSRRYGYGPY